MGEIVGKVRDFLASDRMIALREDSQTYLRIAIGLGLLGVAMLYLGGKPSYCTQNGVDVCGSIIPNPPAKFAMISFMLFGAAAMSMWHFVQMRNEAAAEEAWRNTPPDDYDDFSSRL